ncbi:MAG: ATPase [Caulobacteraceae bacterium]|nr:ATPase [Caulobacteraceae bacterium]
MLQVRQLSKSFPGEHGRHVLFHDLSFSLPRGGRLALMGRNGQGKSSLIKILGGVLPPSAGEIRRSMSLSWPLGFGGAFQGSLTGMDNIRFVSRIYGRSVEEVLQRTADFAELGDALAMPVKHYSSGMRARLAFGLSLAIEFDCYLIDEVISVGDSAFGRKCQQALFERRAERAYIIASHDLGLLKQVCDRAIIIDSGRAKYFDDIELAADIFESLSARRSIAGVPETVQ